MHESMGGRKLPVKFSRPCNGHAGRVALNLRSECRWCRVLGRRRFGRQHCRWYSGEICRYRRGDRWKAWLDAVIIIVIGDEVSLRQLAGWRCGIAGECMLALYWVPRWLQVKPPHSGTDGFTIARQDNLSGIVGDLD